MRRIWNRQIVASWASAPHAVASEHNATLIIAGSGGGGTTEGARSQPAAESYIIDGMTHEATPYAVDAGTPRIAATAHDPFTSVL